MMKMVTYFWELSKTMYNAKVSFIKKIDTLCSFDSPAKIYSLNGFRSPKETVWKVRISKSSTSEAPAISFWCHGCSLPEFENRIERIVKRKGRRKIVLRRVRDMERTLNIIFPRGEFWAVLEIQELNRMIIPAKVMVKIAATKVNKAIDVLEPLFYMIIAV